MSKPPQVLIGAMFFPIHFWGNNPELKFSKHFGLTTERDISAK